MKCGPICQCFSFWIQSHTVSLLLQLGLQVTECREWTPSQLPCEFLPRWGGWREWNGASRGLDLWPVLPSEGRTMVYQLYAIYTYHRQTIFNSSVAWGQHGVIIFASPGQTPLTEKENMWTLGESKIQNVAKISWHNPNKYLLTPDHIYKKKK